MKTLLRCWSAGSTNLYVFYFEGMHWGMVTGCLLVMLVSENVLFEWNECSFVVCVQ